MPSVRSRARDATALGSPRARRRSRAPIAVALAVALLLGVASLAVAQTSRVPASTPSAWPSSVATTAHPYASHVAEASRRFGIPEAWIWSVMRVESAGNPVATSHAGAMGLMQVMPGTYAELRSHYGLGADAYQPRDNIIAGAAYLRQMHDRYGVTGMLAAYNAGPGRWEDYLARGRPLPAETVAYMARLGSTISSSAAPSPTVVAQIDRFAWRRASLFVQLTEVISSRGNREVFGASSLQNGDDPVAPESMQPREVHPTLELPETGGSRSIFAVRKPE